jgi:cytochrome c5
MCMIHRHYIILGLLCHDESVEGAPTIGDQYAWSQRYHSGNAAGLIRSTKK